MSKQLDEKIVAMEFDNSKFEKNVNTSINTLNKLKKNLDFSESTKGLDTLEKGIKKVDFSPMTNALEAVSVKFNALQAVGYSVLNNLVNKATNAGEKLAKSLSIDQWTAGFSKYENKISNMQTIMNSTGKSVEEIEGYLKELTWYSDETSYGMSDMMTALSSGIAAGRNIEELIPMIEGVANATAFAGKNAAEFGHVMQFAMNQALQLGYLGNLDWKTMKSISTPAYQQAYLDAAEELGKITSEQNSRANWGKMLSDKVFDSDVIIAANKKFSDFTRAVYEARMAYIDAGDYKDTAAVIKELADDYDHVGVAAFQSAQTAKTFTEAVDAVKDAVSTSWSDTWEILFGNINEAKVLWTDFCNSLYDIFYPINEIRNELLAGIFRRNMFDNEDALTGQEVAFGAILELMKSIGSVENTLRNTWEYVFPQDDTVNSIQAALGVFRTGTHSIYEFTNAMSTVDEMFGTLQAAAEGAPMNWGDFAEQFQDTYDPTAFESLKDNLEEIGGSWDKFASGLTGVYGTAGKVRTVLQGLGEALGIIGDFLKDNLKFAYLSVKVVLDAFTGSIGNGTVAIFSNMKALRQWIKEHNYLQMIFKFLLGVMITVTEAIKTFIEEHKIAAVVVTVLSKAVTAISTVFIFLFNLFVMGINYIGELIDNTGILSTISGYLAVAFAFIAEKASAAYEVLKGWFNSFRSWATDTDKIKEKFASIGEWFKSLPELLGKGLSRTPSIFSSIFSGFKDIKIDKQFFVNILTTVAGFISSLKTKIGDGLKTVNEFIKSRFGVDVVSTAKNIILGLRNGITKYAPIIFSSIVNFGKNIIEKFKDIFGIKSPSKVFFDIGKFIIMGLYNSFRSKMFGKAVDYLLNNGQVLIDKFKALFGIHSPSAVFFDIGKNIIMGLFNSFKTKMFGKAVDYFLNNAEGLIDKVKKLFGIHSPSKVFMAIGGFIAAGLLIGLTGGFEKIADFFSNIGDKFGEWCGNIVSWWEDGGSIAKAIGHVFNSLGSTVLSVFDMAADVFAHLNFKNIVILGNLITLYILAFKVLQLYDKTIKIVSLNPFTQVANAIEGIRKIEDAYAASLKKKAQAELWESVASAIKAFALAIGIIVAAIVVVAQYDTDELVKGGIVVGIVAGVVVGIAALMAFTANSTKKLSLKELAKVELKMGKIGVVLLAVTAVFKQVTKTAKILGLLDWEEFSRGMIGVTLIMASLGGFMAATKLITGSKNIKKIAPMLLAITGCIMSLGLLVKMLGEMGLAKVAVGVGTVTLLGALLVGFMYLTKVVKGTKEFGEFIGVIAEMSLCVLILSVAVKLVGSMDVATIAKGIISLTLLSGLIVGFIAVTKLVGKSTNIDKVGGMLIKIGVALGIMSIVVRILGGMDIAVLGKGILAIGLIGGIIVGLMAATRLLTGSKNVDKIGAPLLKMAVAIGVLSLAVKLLGGMSIPDMAKGLVGVTLISGIIVGLIFVTKKFGADLPKVTKALLQASIAMGMMALIAVAISLVPTVMLIKGGIAILALSSIVGGLMMAAKFATGSEKTIKSLMGLVIAISAITITMGLIPVENMVRGTLAMSAIMGMLALVLAMSKFANGSVKTIAMLTGSIAAIAGVVALLSLLPDGMAVETATALGILVSTLAGSLALLNTTTKDISKTMTGALGLLSLCPVVLAIVATFALFPDVNVSVTNAAALGILLAAMTGPVLLLSNFTGNIKDVMTGALGLLAMCPILLGIVAIFALFPDVKIGMDNVLALSVMMTVMTVLLMLIVPIGALFYPAIMGLVALAAMIPPLLGVVGVLAVLSMVDNAEANVNLLINVIGAMTQMLVVLAPLAPLAILATAAVTTLLLLMIPVGLLAAAFAWLNEKIPDFQTFLTTGCDIMILLAGKIGEMFGAFINGIATQTMDLLPKLGTSLSEFGVNIIPFLTVMKMVGLDTFLGSAIMALAIGELTAVELLAAVTSFLTGSSFGELGSELSKFMVNSLPFIAGLKMVTPEMASAASALAGTVMVLTGAELLDGIARFFTKGKGFGEMGTQLAAFAPGMKTFAENLTGVDMKVLSSGAKAGKMLAEMASMMPNEGGVASWFAGDNSLAALGPQIADFGKSLKEFSDNATGVDLEVVDTATQAGKMISDMAKEMPNEGGVAGFFAGENSLSILGPEIASFGKSLKEFSDGATGIDLDVVNTAVEAGKAIADMADKMPNEGGVAGFFAGENSLSKVGPQISSFGWSLKRFSDNVSGIDVDAVNTAVQAGKDIASMADVIPNEGGVASWFAGDNSLANFGPQVAEFGTSIKQFSDNIQGMNNQNVTNGSMAGQRIASAFAKVSEAGVNVNKLKTFIEYIPKYGESMKSFYDYVFNISASHFVEKTETLADAITNLSGLTVNFEVTKTDIVSALEAIIDGVESLYTRYKESAKKLMERFGDGLDSGITMYLPGAKLDTPLGKVKQKILGQKMSFKESGKSLIESLKDGIKEAIENIPPEDLVIEPVIRPVVDLSQVSAAANSMHGMFDFSSSTLSASMANAAGNSMNNRQNGDDVIVSAINELGAKIADMGGTSYTINGITYDDGTSVQDAIAQLIRAAKIEKRI